MLFKRCLRIFRFSRITNRSYSKSVSCPAIAPAMEFSMNDYDVIGFDLDHTICKYNLKGLFGLIYDSLAKYLVEELNYPKFLLNRDPQDHHWGQKGIVLDISRGNFLKLDQNYTITTAYHGTSLMSMEDIIKTYGNECKWNLTKDLIHVACTQSYLERPFFIFKDFFTTSAVVLCTRIVDHLDQENGGVPASYNFFPDFVKALHHIYGRHNFKENTGHYFPSIKANPHLYIEKCNSDIKQWLHELHQHKKLFILTSSNADIARCLLQFCIGEDWMDYFDSVITFAKKPYFFTDDNPFYDVKDDVEIDCVSLEEMKPFQIYSQGNTAVMNKFFTSLTGLDEPKVLYFGDSLIEDVYAPSQYANWNTVAVVEEILEKEEEVLKSNIWGSFFHNDSKDEQNMTFWGNLISQHSRIAVPHLNALSGLSITKKLPSFTMSSPCSGYFPMKP